MKSTAPGTGPFHPRKENIIVKKSEKATRLIVTGLLLSLVVLSSAAVQAMDADELIAKNLEATGGLEKIQSIKSVKLTGKFLTQGMEFPFTMLQKRPNMMRIEADIMGATLVQCYSGESGWAINPMAGSTDPQPMSEIEEKSFKLQADMDGPLVNYAEKGYTVEYIGEADVEGTAAHQLKVDTQDGIVMDVFMDAEYFLIIKSSNKMTVDENEFETQTYMSDFQEVDGMVVPFAIETRTGDTVMNQIMMEKIEYGAEVDDSVFVMPEAPTPPAAPEKIE